MEDELLRRLDAIEADIEKLDHKFESYTHLYQFTPVRNVVYWLLTALGSGAVTVLIALAVRTLPQGG